jgi:biopolymer transport protein ExbD
MKYSVLFVFTLFFIKSVSPATELPSASYAVTECWGHNGINVFFAVTQDGRIFSIGWPIKKMELSESIALQVKKYIKDFTSASGNFSHDKDVRVNLKVHKDCSFHHVQKIMQSLSELGYKKIYFITETLDGF